MKKSYSLLLLLFVFIQYSHAGSKTSDGTTNKRVLLESQSIRSYSDTLQKIATSVASQNSLFNFNTFTTLLNRSSTPSSETKSWYLISTPAYKRLMLRTFSTLSTGDPENASFVNSAGLKLDETKATGNFSILLNRKKFNETTSDTMMAPQIHGLNISFEGGVSENIVSIAEGDKVNGGLKVGIGYIWAFRPIFSFTNEAIKAQLQLMDRYDKIKVQKISEGFKKLNETITKMNSDKTELQKLHNIPKPTSTDTAKIIELEAKIAEAENNNDELIKSLKPDTLLAHRTDAELKDLKYNVKWMGWFNFQISGGTQQYNLLSLDLPYYKQIDKARFFGTFEFKTTANMYWDGHSSGKFKNYFQLGVSVGWRNNFEDLKCYKVRSGTNSDSTAQVTRSTYREIDAYEKKKVYQTPFIGFSIDHYFIGGGNIRIAPHPFASLKIDVGKRNFEIEPSEDKVKPNFTFGIGLLFSIGDKENIKSVANLEPIVSFNDVFNQEGFKDCIKWGIRVSFPFNYFTFNKLAKAD